MNKTHAGGSALSYAKRYLLLMIFNVTIGDPGRASDDDGNSAGGNNTITDKQAAELIKLLDDAGGDKRKFCEAMGVDGIALIAASSSMRCCRLRLRVSRSSRLTVPRLRSCGHCGVRLRADRSRPATGNRRRANRTCWSLPRRMIFASNSR